MGDWAVPLAAGGIAAVCEGAGAAAGGGLAGAAGAAAVDGLPGAAPPPPLLGLLHPPMAKPIQATAIPSAVRFMIFS